MLKSKEKLLNLNYSDVANRTYSVGKYDLPYISCKMEAYPDYIALYSEKNDYHKTENTAVSFYQYDVTFDGIFSIYNAIYYDVPKLKDYYIKRLKGVKYIIAPDYSQCGDMHEAEKLYRIFKARIVSVWLTTELGITVIPNITYADEKGFENMLDGMENTNTVAFSTKGSMRSDYMMEMMRQAVKISVDRLDLKAIIVYSDQTENDDIYSIFDYALKNNVKLIVPSNSLRERNIILRKNGYGKI